MTAHTPIKAALQSPSRQPAPSVSVVAADGHDTLDDDEAHEAAREEALEEFNEWRGWDWQHREFADFGDWLVRRAQPHMVDHEKYGLAMNYAERRSLLPGLLSDEELEVMAKRHRERRR